MQPERDDTGQVTAWCRYVVTGKVQGADARRPGGHEGNTGPPRRVGSGVRCQCRTRGSVVGDGCRISEPEV